MLIGLSGKIGSGKSTVADLMKLRKREYQIKAFAHKVKEITSLMTGVSLGACYSQEGKNTYLKDWGMTVGEFQQKLGTEAIRNNLHPDAWVLALFSDYTDNQHWIITDVRFPNEAVAIKSRGGILVRMEGDPVGVRANSKRDLNHASETSLDNYDHWDYIIQNTSTLQALEAEVFEFVTDQRWRDKI